VLRAYSLQGEKPAQADGQVIREDNETVAVTTSSLTMEVMAVLSWLKTQTFPRAYVLGDSMSKY
jgi:hypothetical protein